MAAGIWRPANWNHGISYSRKLRDLQAGWYLAGHGDRGSGEGLNNCRDHKDVPADICEICGEYYLTEELTEKVKAMVEGAVQKDVEVEVLRFAAWGLATKYGLRDYFVPRASKFLAMTELTSGLLRDTVLHGYALSCIRGNGRPI